MRRVPVRFPLALAACWLSGCAVHVPMSETLVFGDRSEPAGRATSSVEERIVGFQASGGPLVADSVRALNARARGGGLFAAVYSTRTAVSSVVGPAVLGLDVTQHIAGPVYGLASGSLLGGAEAFALTRLTPPARPLGVSVGAGGRCRYDYRDDPENDSEFVLAFRYKGAWTCSVGGRATVLWRRRPEDDKPLDLLGTAYVGVSPHSGRPVAAVGLAFGSR